MAKRKVRASEQRYNQKGKVASERLVSTVGGKVSPFIELARSRWSQADEADRKQREREKEDIAFYNGEQWEEQIKQARSGQNTQNGLPPTPAKPCLTINKVRPPVNQIIATAQQADMGIYLTPADDFTTLTGEPLDHTEIELREGLIRKIQRQSDAQDARMWAFRRVAQAGRGYYGVTIDYTNSRTKGPGVFDQDIKIVRFYNQFAVLLDPAHEQPDGSDAEWAFVGVDLPWDQYESQFPKDADGRTNKLLGADDDDWRALGDEAPEWFTTEGETRSVRVVDYYFTERQAQTVYELADGTTTTEKPDDESLIVNERRVIIKTIKRSKIDGIQELERTDWPGHYIPIIKILGIELQPYDRQRLSEGIVHSSIDSQRGFNYMVSEWVFRMALAPLPPLMIVEGQQEGYEEWYKQANVRALPYLPYKATDVDGRIVSQPPFRAPVEIPVAEYAQSVSLFDQTIKATTDVPDAALGQVPQGLRSGKLAQMIIEQSQQGNSGYLDNLRRSMEHEARIVNDLLYPIYGTRPGRLLSMVSGDHQVTPVLYGTPMVHQGEAPQLRALPAQPGQEGAKTYTLSDDGDWNIAIKVSKNYETQRQEEVAQDAELIQAQPELMMWFGDLFFANQDSPNAREKAKRARVMLAPPIKAMLDGSGNPQALQAQIMQLQQQVQELVPLADKNKADLMKVQIQEQHETGRALQKQQAEDQRAQADNETKLAVAELSAKVDKLALFLEERARLGLQGQQDAQSELDRQHERDLAAQQHQQEMAQAQQSNEAAAQAQDAAHQQAMEQQAAAQPPQGAA